MTEAMLILIAVLVVLAVITCLLLVAVQLHEAAATRATAERRLMQVRFEIGKLRRELREK
ncbi:hypothetical protein P12x_005336 [Tundrisphaera lichenicola]|uniref:hypothetical protein n=1 Tax=Tundrisphaera lichenicola TaxID=2029860 RepID=UPI003EBCE8AD